MELLLKVFHNDYIKTRFPALQPALHLLAGFEGDHDKFGKGRITGLKFQGIKMLPDKFADKLPNPGSILKKEMLFSSFVKLVMTDTINLDECKTFHDHCQGVSSYLLALKTTKTNQKMTSDMDSDDDDTPKTSKSLQEQANHANKQILGMAKGRIGSIELQRKALLYLKEENLIKNVTVHENTLKSLITEELQHNNTTATGKSSEPSKLKQLLSNLPESFLEYKAKKKRTRKRKY